MTQTERVRESTSVGLILICSPQSGYNWYQSSHVSVYIDNFKLGMSGNNLCCHCTLAVCSFPEGLCLSPQTSWHVNMCMIDVHDCCTWLMCMTDVHHRCAWLLYMTDVHDWCAYLMCMTDVHDCCTWLMCMTDLQGAVYHWTISTGFSLAEATNLYVGPPRQLLSHLQDTPCCAQLAPRSPSSFLSPPCTILYEYIYIVYIMKPHITYHYIIAVCTNPICICICCFCVLVFECMWGMCTLV